MNQGSNNYAAPFGKLVTGSTISNLTVANSSFTADNWVAGITCENSGTITNCTVGAKFVLSNSLNQQSYGGIVGYNYGASPVSGIPSGVTSPQLCVSHGASRSRESEPPAHPCGEMAYGCDSGCRGRVPGASPQT